MLFFDPIYFLFSAPAVLLGLWAQNCVKAAFAEAEKVGTSMTGAEAGRRAKTMVRTAPQKHRPPEYRFC